MTNVVQNATPKWQRIAYRSCLFVVVIIYFPKVKKIVLVPIRNDHKMEFLEVQHDPWKVADNKQYNNSE